MKALIDRWRAAGSRLAELKPTAFAALVEHVVELARRRATQAGLPAPKAVKATATHLEEHRRRLVASIQALDKATEALTRRERLAAGECDHAPGCSGAVSIAWCRDCGTIASACDAHGKMRGARDRLAHHVANRPACTVALVGFDLDAGEGGADLQAADEALAAVWAIAMRDAGAIERARAVLQAGDRRNECDLWRPGHPCTGAIHVRWCACCGEAWRRCLVHGGLRGATHAHDQHIEASHSRRGAETTPGTVASSPR